MPTYKPTPAQKRAADTTFKSPPGTHTVAHPQGKPQTPAQSGAQAKSINRRQVLLKVGYRVPDSIKSVNAAWKNYQAALRQGLHIPKAAQFWNRNSKLAVPKTTTIDINGPHPGTGISTATPGKGLSSKPTVSTTVPVPKGKPVKPPKPQAPPSPQVMGFDPSQLEALSNSGMIGNLLPTSLAKTGRVDAASLADAMAGAQYDSQIADLQRQIAQQPRQAAQNQADITNWYAQVLGAQKNAGQEDAAMSAAATPSISNADAAIIASLGGSANQGAGTVAQSAANDVGTLQALGQNEADYNNDIVQILQGAAAGAKTDEKNRQLQLASDLTHQLLDAQNTRGQQKAADLGQLTQFNIGQADQQKNNLLSILNANNALRQQGFSNNLAAQSAAAAALYQGARAQYYANGGGGQNRQPKLGTFARMSPEQKSGLVSKILNTLPDPSQGSSLTPAQTRAKITMAVRNAGINPALHQDWINSIYSTYQSYFPQQTQ